jgi:hypothetical protein
MKLLKITIKKIKGKTNAIGFLRHNGKLKVIHTIDYAWQGRNFKEVVFNSLQELWISLENL